MRALILPGMDGTGQLLVEFAAALAPEFEAQIVAYPPTLSAYDALFESTRARLPASEPFILIAESFSGPIGIRLAASRPRGLKGLALCATFAASPRPLSRYLSPLLRLPLPKPPTALLMPVMMGRWRTPDWTRRQQAATSGMSSTVARSRLAEVLRVDATTLLSQIGAPTLYLQASDDRLVPRSCWQAIRARLPEARCVQLDGPHFLLQHQPVRAADAIKRHLLEDAARNTPVASY